MFTNLTFFFAGLVVLRLGELHLALSYIAVSVASSIYHVNRNTEYFGTDVTASRAAAADEITAIQAVMATIMLFAYRPRFGNESGPLAFIWNYVSIAFTWGSAAYFNYYFGNDPTYDAYYLIPGSAALVGVMFTFSVVTCQGRESRIKHPNWLYLGLALVFAAAATIFYFVSHYHNYNLWWHGGWHIAAAGAGICAVLAKKAHGIAGGDLRWFFSTANFVELVRFFDDDTQYAAV